VIGQDIGMKIQKLAINVQLILIIMKALELAPNALQIYQYGMAQLV